ncbi:tetratricopeptide repeat protein [Hyalangium rubrum]|uniref:Tetratricopeptide repeat protein n=1 Tax=Hyalangium rubrum TaxID=3103134 RepID=A0ABU5H2Z9_9BACT|nr:hypothetical protein [Hyalangium sp. s54d21]MDY7227824.1 hypothetical protein [Hyalangium sp. s54d21]
MSTVSTGTAPSRPQEEPLALPSALPLEADPSGLTERAPVITTLLPDEALARALAAGDSFAVHAVLSARMAREPRGPTRDTLRQLLAHPVSFAVAERPPGLGELKGTGVGFIGLPPPSQQEVPFIATRAVRVLGVAVWPLSQHLVRRDSEGNVEVLGRVPTSARFRVRQWVSKVALGAVGLVCLAGIAMPFITREVSLINGLSRPVEVSVDGRRTFQVAPGSQLTISLRSLSGPHKFEARWPGETKPFEEFSLRAEQRNFYNVLGAASFMVDDAAEYTPPRRVDFRAGALGPDDMMWKERLNWEETVQEHADAGRLQAAGELAQSIALADPTSLRAREAAAHWLMRYNPSKALEFAQRLISRYPDDRAAHELFQDVYGLLGHETTGAYVSMDKAAPDASVGRALVQARSRRPEEQREAYARVLERFPDSFEAQRAMARLRLADGYPQRALELLDEALVKAPESVEDLELRVRALIALKRVGEASRAVQRYVEATARPRRSWELAVLAGRLARLAGPDRTPYITDPLLPAEFMESPAAQLRFTLMTGFRTLKDEELNFTGNVTERESLWLAFLILGNAEKAAAQVSSAKDGVLNRLPLEAAAILALELTRQGDTQAAERLFGTHFALMKARKPLEAYVRSGEVQPRFPMLPPDLLAVAYLVRARAVDKDAFIERAYARWTDGLGGFARRALDPDYVEPEYRDVKPVDGPQPRLPRPWSVP